MDARVILLTDYSPSARILLALLAHDGVSIEGSDTFGRIEVPCLATEAVVSPAAWESVVKSGAIKRSVRDWKEGHLATGWHVSMLGRMVARGRPVIACEGFEPEFCDQPISKELRAALRTEQEACMASSFPGRGFSDRVANVLENGVFSYPVDDLWKSNPLRGTTARMAAEVGS